MVNVHGAQVVFTHLSVDVVLIKFTGPTSLFLLKKMHDLENLIGLAPQIMTAGDCTCSRVIEGVILSFLFQFPGPLKQIRTISSSIYI